MTLRAAVEHVPCPKVKIFFISTLKKLRVCPWDLWMVIAQERMRGT